MKALELGIFLPIGRNGFIISRTAPQYDPSFTMNKQIALRAEELGFDYVFSMSKWRGFGGATGFWDASLESLTLMTGLAAITSRIGIITTIQPLLFPPAVAAKLTATIDDVSNGRLGINIVTGATLEEYEPMGVLPPGYGPNRYRYAAEWLHVVKRLWSEESVTFDGEWFHLKDCRSAPKPIQKPHPTLVCAALSDEGSAFTAKECDYSFLGGKSNAQIKQFSRRIKALAAEAGREIKTATTILAVIDDSDAAAERRWQRYQDGADVEALDNIAGTFSRQSTETARVRLEKATRSVSFTGRAVTASPSTLAEMLEDLAVDGGLDSIQLLFVDYIEGMERFATEVMPRLRRATGGAPASSA